MSRDSLIEDYQHYVRYLVGCLTKSLHLPLEHFDEFVAAGYLGLVEAAERYDSDSGVEFRHFAYLRIRGAIIDCLRNYSALSGRAYRYAKALRAAQDLRETMQMEQQQHRRTAALEDRDGRIAKLLDYAAKGALAYRLSMADASDAVSCVRSPGPDPEEVLRGKQEIDLCRKIVEELPERERRVIKGYYFSGKSLAQIAQESGRVSKSWVSRLHTRALDRIKKRYLEAIS